MNQGSDPSDRPCNLYNEGTYARSGTYTEEDGIPQAGGYFEAGIGRMRAEVGVHEAETKGPSVGASAKMTPFEMGAMARAELASISGGKGPLKAKLGLAVDTGFSVGKDGIDIKVLGTGVKLGTTLGFSVLGTGMEYVIK